VFTFKSEKTNELNDWAIIFTAHILGQLVITSQAMSVDPPEVLWTLAAKIAVHTKEIHAEWFFLVNRLNGLS
jgi:hypothetical protein